MNNGIIFFSLSILLRLVLVTGSLTIGLSTFPLGQQEVGKDHTGKLMGALECFLTMGTMLGLALGGVLYDAGGFYLPSLVVGIVFILVGVLATLLLILRRPYVPEEPKNVMLLPNVTTSIPQRFESGS